MPYAALCGEGAHGNGGFAFGLGAHENGGFMFGLGKVSIRAFAHTEFICTMPQRFK